MKYITAFFMAWGNFFAVPCPCKLWDNNLRRLQLVFFPVIGLLMGLIWYLLFTVMSCMRIPLALQAAVIAAYPYLISGFIHLDGYMDCCDAILSRRELEERQRILKDSHVGAFAVICAGMLFMFAFAGAWSLAEYAELSKALILIPMLSRVCSAYGVLNFEPIGHSQYKASFDRRINRHYGIVLAAMAVIALGTALYLGEKAAAVAGLLVIAVHFAMMWNGRRQLGGMSGDIAGYALTLSECAGLLAVAVAGAWM
ncbi:MAG: adenosylcobinamide-GDP ribazoletransferase [Anaerovoracaceae bacterium]